MNDLIVYVLAASATKVRHAKKKKTQERQHLVVYFFILLAAHPAKNKNKTLPNNQ